MKIPWFEIGSAVTAALGLAGWWWYESLGQEDKEKADRMAEEVAKQLYGVGMNALAQHQQARVQEFVKRRFAP